MLNNGIDRLVASRRLGDARPSNTMNIYGHLLPHKQAEAAQLLDQIVTPIELSEISPGYTRLHTNQVSPE